MKSIIRVAAVLAVALLATAVVSAVPATDQPAGQSLDTSTVESAAAPWEYMGCHYYSETLQCHDIFRDTDGALWYCGLCDTSYGANEVSCNRVYGYLGFCLYFF